VARYEHLYGRGSALAGVQLEFAVYRVRARALTPRPKLIRLKRASSSIPEDAIRKPRAIHWSSVKKTPVYDGEILLFGNMVRGPAIVETADTTVVVHPGTTLKVDALGNFEITFRK
jgi:N-methylhydantoinase A